MENPIKIDDLGVPLFPETSMWLLGVCDVTVTFIYYHNTPCQSQMAPRSIKLLRCWTCRWFPSASIKRPTILRFFESKDMQLPLQHVALKGQYPSTLWQKLTQLAGKWTPRRCISHSGIFNCYFSLPRVSNMCFCSSPSINFGVKVSTAYATRTSQK